MTRSQVFVWLDASNHTTTGTTVIRNTPAPELQVSSSISTSNNGTNDTLLYQVDAHRQVTISSTIVTSKGSQDVSWHQDYSFTSFGNYTDSGNVEVNTLNTRGLDVSSSGYSRRLDYDLNAFSSYLTNGDNYTIQATVDRVKDVDTVGSAVFPSGLESFSVAQALRPQYPAFQGASLSTTQNGTATYIANATSLASFSFGTTAQDMVFSGIEVSRGNANSFPPVSGSTELFHRYVKASNGSVVQDDETLIGSSIPHRHGHAGSTHGFGVGGIRGQLGHGPAQINLTPPNTL